MLFERAHQNERTLLQVRTVEELQKSHTEYFRPGGQLQHREAHQFGADHSQEAKRSGYE